MGERRQVRARVVGVHGLDLEGDAGRAPRSQFGTVWINEHFTLASETPHGGVKESGYGKDGSKYALEDYTTVKHITINTGI